ncbi:MAG: hypothetical protein SVV03_03925, partial [Candidatus Nanohaloarchaea archaeon]|nr:hypothetical protein [Candidatus Nanohaloarchaea archaeon]
SVGSQSDANSFDKIVGKSSDKCEIANSPADTNEPFEVNVSFSRLNSLEVQEGENGLQNKFVGDFADSSRTRTVSECGFSLTDDSEGDSTLQSGDWSVEVRCENECGSGSQTPQITLIAETR